MKTTYDMSTGQVFEIGHSSVPASNNAPHTYEAEPELGLQLVTSERSTEIAFPPELVLADLNAFLDKMS